MRVLVVDDDQLIHELISVALSNGNYEILHAFSADDALRQFCKHGDIGLIITDIVMPGQDGTKLIKQIRAVRDDIPVLAITGGVENAIDDYVGLASLYSDYTLAKPFTRKALIEGIEQASERVISQNQNGTGTSEESLFDELVRILGKCDGYIQ
ncbi:MAG: response regulator [Micavibrio aeruginosavorus]|uniref:Response regulator n=1 Tax=Micavibrio aeruginosavorus TaxID=349221 RepID=A0A7T5UG44_9BACT|nr:MAG: response regulator [Micavibrio aeruginosavorus]